MSSSFKIDGVAETISSFRSLGANAEKIAGAVVASIADKIVLDAKQSAPADLGGIRQGIAKEKLGPSLYAVNASAPESAYQEFGTGGKVVIPPEMSSIASEFKGVGGGDFKAFILALTDWVRRHGGAYGSSYSVKTHRRSGKASVNRDLDERAAYAIARSILKNGLKPQPYLYPAFVENSAKLLPALEQAFTTIQFGLNNSRTFTSDSEYY